MVKLHTNFGVITLELDAARAPETVENFLGYVASRHYTNTIFHRVIDGFMIQGGGFEPGMKQKPTQRADQERGPERAQEHALHRRDGAHVRAALRDRAILHQRERQRLPRSPGRARRAGATACSAASPRAGRGRRIKAVKTGRRGMHQDVPVEDVIIERAEVVG